MKMAGRKISGRDAQSYFVWCISYTEGEGCQMPRERDYVGEDWTKCVCPAGFVWPKW
jgi:hypothetical protein